MTGQDRWNFEQSWASSTNLISSHHETPVNELHQSSEQKVEQEGRLVWELETLGIRDQDKEHENLLDITAFKRKRYSEHWS